MKRRGFTLIEVLVVTAILAVLGAAIASCIGAGIRVWDAVRGSATRDINAELALMGIARDLRNALPFHAIEFHGAATELSFAAVMADDAGEESSGPVRRIGLCGYRLDRDAGELLRETSRYPAEAEGGARVERVLSGVTRATLQYLPAGGDAAAGGGEWVAEWQSTTNLPRAVRVALVLAGGDRPLASAATVLLPIGESP